MSSGIMYEIRPAVPKVDRSDLEKVIANLQENLKTINEKLANLRNITRKECNIKKRHTYLSSIHTLVTEQHRTQSFLENYKTKLTTLRFRGKKELITRGTQKPTKNTKLFELFEPKETKLEIKSVKSIEASAFAKRQKTENHQHQTGIKNIKLNENSISNHGEAMKCLKAHVDNRKMIVQRRGAFPECVEQEPLVINDPIVDVEVEQTVVEDRPVGQQDVATKSIAIDNHSDAMQCLKALQEYAMLNENFRAIGLLMQAEEAFSNPADVNDFEL